MPPESEPVVGGMPLGPDPCLAVGRDPSSFGPGVASSVIPARLPVPVPAVGEETDRLERPLSRQERRAAARSCARLQRAWERLWGPVETPVPPWPGGIHVPGLGVVPPLGGPRVPSTLSLDGIRKWFGRDRPLVDVLLAMVAYGVNAMYEGPQVDRMARDHPSLVQAALAKYIREGRRLGAVEGPFASVDAVRAFLRAMGLADRLHRNPRGCVPKPGADPPWRIIDDKSAGFLDAVNAWISLSGLETVQMDGLRVVTRLIQKARAKYGRTAKLVAFKVDIEAAFRRLVLRMADWWLGLMSIADDARGEVLYYLDVACSFGMRSSVFWFGVFSLAIRRCGRDLGAFWSVYVDDILGIEEASRAQASLDLLLEVITDIGFTVQERKVEPPTQVIEYIGFIVDLGRLEFRISAKRLAEIRALVESWHGRTRASRRDLERLVGKLLFCVEIARVARLFVERLLTAMRGLARPSHRCHITREMRLDLEWWRDFLPSWSARAAIPEVEPPVMDMDLASDASFVGWAAHCRGLDGAPIFIAGTWSAAERRELERKGSGMDINVAELHTAVMAVSAFAPALAGRRVRFLIDNQAAVGWIRGWRASSGRAAHLLRMLFSVLARFDIVLEPEYIRSEDNVRADALSRLDFALFLAVSAGLYRDRAPVQLPVAPAVRRPWLVAQAV